MNERQRDLEDELRDWKGWPAAWRPEPGEIVVGIVESFNVGQSPYGPVRTCILRKDDGSRVSIWLSSMVLLSLFAQQRPKVGERIGLKYEGRDKQKNYHRYRLVVDRPQEDAGVDFTPLGGEVNINDELPF